VKEHHKTIPDLRVLGLEMAGNRRFWKIGSLLEILFPLFVHWSRDQSIHFLLSLILRIPGTGIGGQLCFFLDR
jgi:hypothetical protein